MHKGVARRPMPAEQSVHWKPLRDSHYVLASLQPADGGRRQIFIRQAALARVERLARAVRGRHAFGLLFGHLFECSVSGANYLVIESLSEQPNALSDEAELAAAVSHAQSNAANGNVVNVGWYCSAPVVGTRPAPGIASIHESYFPEPWQTTLLVADGSSTAGGAFLLRDTSASRWFYAPFYELPDHARTSEEPKSTCIAWPQYMTVDAVVTVSRDQASPGHDIARRAGPPHEPAAPQLFRSDGDRQSATPAVGRLAPDAPPPPSERIASGDTAADITVEKAADAAPERFLGRMRDRISAWPSRSTPNPTREPSPEKLPIVDDSAQRVATTSDGVVRRISDSEDTTASDEPSRYLELARSEGFFVAVKFDYTEAASETEHLWLLNEPYSGMLLTVTATDDEVLDASLHYNLRADEAALRTAFPSHCDLASRTIYVRESCVDFLRARCRRLRATNALERVWKVSPTIYLLTPGEWLSATARRDDPGGEAGTIQALNDARIAALPIAIRHQFRLTPRPDDTHTHPDQANSGPELPA